MRIILIVGMLALAGCGDSGQGDQSNVTGTLGEVAPSPAPLPELTRYFGKEKPFCSYANNIDILVPTNVKKAPIKGQHEFWDSSLAKFDAMLYGLKVVGVANFRMEGIGANAIIFDEPASRVFDVLVRIYGNTNPNAAYFPAGTNQDKSLACPDCEAGMDHPEFTAIRDKVHSQEFYGVGKSTIECGFFD